ncbi:hypothetical protein LO772_07970 [Yinghuangia sp. ASG 101]|uniref:hypothetical protein n=1 Tax=Yinghuangia sp. ASG 101 TaxID=2896848 RepID=UPI001E419FBF|nr:hypothetical protein [Yinghuangia sp. ASG 101]UGQ13530.1 hypothetical protein LO772_07970 [Yinghuangia sp. ASG 101]
MITRARTQAATSSPAQGILALWAADALGGTAEPAVNGLRFAFYGRVSTEDHQDPVTSKAWQLLRA